MTKETIANVVSTLKMYDVFRINFEWHSVSEKIVFNAMELKDQDGDVYTLSTYTPTLDAFGEKGEFEMEWCINIIIDHIIKDAGDLEIIEIDGSLEIDGDGILYDAELTTESKEEVTGHLTD